MAKAIAKSGGKIPAIITKTLEDAIASRREGADWYKGQHSTEISNEGHTYFIDILRDAQEILAQLAPSNVLSNDTTAGAIPATSNIMPEELGNRFAYLEVEEPAEWTAAAPFITANKLVVTYDLEPSKEEASFAIYCMMKDMTDIRYYIHQT